MGHILVVCHFRCPGAALFNLAFKIVSYYSRCSALDLATIHPGDTTSSRVMESGKYDAQPDDKKLRVKTVGYLQPNKYGTGLLDPGC